MIMHQGLIEYICIYQGMSDSVSCLVMYSYVILWVFLCHTKVLFVYLWFCIGNVFSLCNIVCSVSKSCNPAIMQSHDCAKYLRNYANFGLMNVKQEKKKH